MVSFYSILFQRVDVAEGGFRLPYNNTPAAAGMCVLGGGVSELGRKLETIDTRTKVVGGWEGRMNQRKTERRVQQLDERHESPYYPQPAAPAHNSKQDSTGHQRLIEHPQHHPADVKGLQPPQKHLYA